MKISSAIPRLLKKNMHHIPAAALRTAGVILAAAIVLCTALPVWAQGPGDRSFGVYDYGELLSDSEESRLTEYAGELSRKWDINVILATTVDKENYPNSDSGTIAYAEEIYSQTTGAPCKNDASGFLFIIDMENRYLYIYTYDGVHRMISDSQCEDITDSIVADAQVQNYMGCMTGVLGGIDNKIQGYRTRQEVICWSIRIGAPLLVTGIVLMILLLHKRSKSTTTFSTYIDAANCKTVNDQDVFTHNTVIVTHHTSSSGGGGGGGGGGHSGGGGSHF